MSDYTNPSGTTNTSKNLTTNVNSTAEKIGRSISELLDLQLALGSIIKNIVDRLAAKETIEASDIEHYSHLMKKKIDNTLGSVPQANCESKENTDEKK